MHVDVEPLPAERIPEALEVLVQSFMQDANINYLLPDVSSRPATLRKLMQVLLRIMRKHGEAYCVIQTRVVAVFLVVPPGRYPIPSLRLFADLLSLCWKVSPAFVFRLLRDTHAIESAHHRLMKDPHWYLFMLAAHPVEGRFAGRALLEYVLARADKDQVPAYCEVFNKGNLPLFGRQYGFSVMEEINAGKEGRHMWSMLRAARQETAERHVREQP